MSSSGTGPPAEADQVPAGETDGASARYLIVSDLHICDVEDHADGWKRYKSSQYVFDAELAELMRDFRRGAKAGAELTLILNGDIFDFDLVTDVPKDPPWPVSRSERMRGLDATEAKSVWKLERILDHHPELVHALAEFVSRGHRIVYVMGNHDREFHFPRVQQTLRAAIETEVERLANERLEPDRLVFEPWFYYVPGHIYAEHGQQYDRFSTFRYVLAPEVSSGGGPKQIAVPMGNLSCRYLINRMGYFNPHASDFLLSLFEYLAHWLRHYALSRRSLVLNWMWGSTLALFHTLRIRRRVVAQGPAEQQRRLEELAERNGLSRDELEALQGLQLAPVSDQVHRLARELWLDRVAIAIAMICATIALALTAIPLWIKLMVPLTAFPMVYLLYEALVHEDTYADEQHIPDIAREISGLLQCPVVAFGHTHRPMVIPLARGQSFVNVGTWTPTWEETPEVLSPGRRNFAIATFEESRADVSIDSWMLPEAVAVEPDRTR
jgi:UDP-2,3-diacylglucosamine pyrophosphatase LpxH